MEVGTDNRITSVIEGAFPIIKDNEIYLTYSANQSYGNTYCTGLLKFVGESEEELTDASKWVKYENPIHQSNQKDRIISTGAMIFLPGDNENEMIGVYHAKQFYNVGWRRREIYMQKVVFAEDKVNLYATMRGQTDPVLEEGANVTTIKFLRADNTLTNMPESVDTVYTTKANSLPLRERISEFEIKEGEKDTTAPILSSLNVTNPETGTYKEGETIIIVATYSEDIYANKGKGTITSNTAPVLKIKFGDGEEKIATFNSASGNIITYTYIIESGDNGVLETTDYTGIVYDQAGNSLEVENKAIEGSQIIADTKEDEDNNDDNEGEVSGEGEEPGEGETPDQNEIPNNEQEINNQGQQGPNDKENIKYYNEDDNLATKLLPKTGAIKISAIIIIITAIMAGMFYYKYKKT